eukprot:451646_1
MGAADSSDYDEKSTDQKSTEQITLFHNKNIDIYIRNCKVEELIKILNSYAINRLLQHYQKSTNSVYISIIKENHSKIIQYFRNNEIDGNAFCKQDKNKFTIDVVKYIKTSDTHVQKMKQILSTLYRIIINYANDKDIVEYKDNNIENKQNINQQIATTNVHNIYVRKCEVKEMIKILNNYAIDRLLQYYQTSEDSEYILIIKENRNKVIQYFRNNEIDGNSFCNRDKNTFVINIVKYIKTSEQHVHINNINKIKDILFTLYRIIINYANDKDIVEYKDNNIENKQNINQQIATTNVHNIYVRKCEVKEMIKILNNYAIDRLLQYYQTSEDSEYILIIKENRNKVIQYFRNNEIDGNSFCNRDKNTFVINIVKYIKTSEQHVHINNINKIKDILFTLYRIIINYESYLDTSSHANDKDVVAEYKDKIENKQNTNEHIATITKGNIYQVNNAESFDLSISKMNIYENDCHEDIKCPLLNRLLNALKYYNMLDITTDSKHQQLFEEFIDTTYYDLINDYIHFTQQHFHQIEKINNVLLTKCNIMHKTTADSLHVNNSMSKRNFYKQTMDNVHYYLYHFNVSAPFFPRINKMISERKYIATSFDRFALNKNNKFSIKTIDNQQDKIEKDDQVTFIDNLIDNMTDKNISQSEIFKFRSFLQENQYDTDALDYDMNLLSGNSFIKNHTKEIKLIKCMEGVKLLGWLHEVGFKFYYWDYYKSKKQLQPDDKPDEWFNSLHLKAHSPSEMFIVAKYRSFKEEIAASKHVNMLQYKKEMLVKVDGYINSKIVKATTARQLEYLHTGIREGEPITFNHLLSIVLYCDYSDLSSNFSSSFRTMRRLERLTSIKKRNSNYYWLSRYLCETVQNYGDCGRGIYDTNTGEYVNKISGPFYCGMSVLLHVESLPITLNHPTSTSAQIEVAIKFSGPKGIIIQLNNNTYYGSMVRIFNVSWISRYKEEDERLFFQSGLPVRIESIRVRETQQNFETIQYSLWVLDCIVQGHPLGTQIHMSNKDILVLRTLLNNCLNKQTTLTLDKYIYDSFNAHCGRREVVLNLWCLHKFSCDEIVGIFMHPMKRDRANTQNTSADLRTNLFKLELFHIYMNLRTVVIHTSSRTGQYSYSLDLTSLLSAIETSNITVIIKARVINCCSQYHSFDDSEDFNVVEFKSVKSEEKSDSIDIFYSDTDGITIYSVVTDANQNQSQQVRSVLHELHLSKESIVTYDNKRCRSRSWIYQIWQKSKNSLKTLFNSKGFSISLQMCGLGEMEDWLSIEPLDHVVQSIHQNTEQPILKRSFTTKKLIPNLDQNKKVFLKKPASMPHKKYCILWRYKNDDSIQCDPDCPEATAYQKYHIDLPSDSTKILIHHEQIIKCNQIPSIDVYSVIDDAINKQLLQTNSHIKDAYILLHKNKFETHISHTECISEHECNKTYESEKKNGSVAVIKTTKAGHWKIINSEHFSSESNIAWKSACIQYACSHIDKSIGSQLAYASAQHRNNFELAFKSISDQYLMQRLQNIIAKIQDAPIKIFQQKRKIYCVSMANMNQD